VQCWPAQRWPPPCSPPPSSPNYCHTCGNTAGTGVSYGSATNNKGYLIYQAERLLSRTELHAVDTARGEVARSLWVPITYATRRYSSIPQQIKESLCLEFMRLDRGAAEHATRIARQTLGQLDSADATAPLDARGTVAIAGRGAPGCTSSTPRSTHSSA
jgi:hypothetical protein